MKLIRRITTKIIAYISVFVAIISVALIFEAESAIGLYVFAFWTLIVSAIVLIKASEPGE